MCGVLVSVKVNQHNFILHIHRHTTHVCQMLHMVLTYNYINLTFQTCSFTGDKNQLPIFTRAS
jgi:hypothetical protein